MHLGNPWRAGLAIPPVLWAAGFLLAAWLAPTAAVARINRAVAGALLPLGHAVPPLQVIWELGGVPLTGGALLLWGLARPWRWSRQGVVWAAFIAGSVVELAAKHWIGLPSPRPVPVPPPYAQLEPYLNIGPQTLAQAWHLLHPASGASGHHFLVGTFPSGHVFRLTFTVGVLAGRPGRRWWWVAGIAAVVTGIAVVSTGGHWLWDTVGGALLAGGCLVFSRPRSGG